MKLDVEEGGDGSNGFVILLGCPMEGAPGIIRNLFHLYLLKNNSVSVSQTTFSPRLESLVYPYSKVLNSLLKIDHC
jgi:hypothetical protein